MIFILFIFAEGSLDLSFPFNCSSLICPSYYRSNGLCDTSCMTPSCNYDSSDSTSSTWFLRFQESGCFSRCLNTGCNVTSLKNTVCDSSCNNIYCGFDLGECGYCASSCTKEMLQNNVCDPACNVSQCMYDNNACGWCAPGCFYEDLKLTTCKQECANAACNYQNLTCNENFCAAGCSPEMQFGTTCYSACNNKQCDYGNSVCLCSEGCIPDLYSDTVCHSECDNSQCNLQNYVCGDCASECFDNMIGNGVCDIECNNENCGYDSGDCSCAPGCDSFYDTTTQQWSWDSDPCNLNCLVESCLFNYGVCQDNFLIRASLFYQLYYNDPSIVLNWNNCISSSKSCSSDIMSTIDSSETCNPNCDSPSCVYCMGFSQVSNDCLRSKDSTDSNFCFICPNENTQIYDYCTTGPCPSGFEVVDELTPVFLGTRVCLRSVEINTINNFFEIYVNTAGEPHAIGAVDYPTNSIWQAFALVTRKYTKIFISPGTYSYEKQTSQTNPLITEYNSPLSTIVSLHLQQLWIIGTDSNEKSVINVYAFMQIDTDALEFHIVNVIINGSYSLNQNCNTDTCTFCPRIYSKGNDVYLDDKGDSINNISEYSTQCSKYITLKFIIVYEESTLYLENVDVLYFQQQYYSFIYSQGSVYLSNVNFDRIQAYEEGAFIVLDCSNCKSLDFSYRNGRVINLNYGYEYKTDIYQSGFIKTQKISSFLMQNVVFDFDMVVTGISLTTYNYLIWLINTKQTITVSNCAFSNIFANSVLYIDASTLSYKSYNLDMYDNIIEYINKNFLLTSSTFSNIGCFTCVICYSMNTIVQNIEIDSCSFQQLVSGGNGIISILNTGGYNTIDLNGGTMNVNVNGEITSAYAYPKSLNINYVNFYDVTYAGSLLFINNYPNLYFESIKIETTNDMSYNDFNIYVVDNFVYSPITNVYYELQDGAVNTNPCKSLIYIDVAFVVYFSDINITQTSCTGYSGLVTMSSTYFVLLSSNFYNLYSDSNQLLYSNSNKYVYIDFLTLNNIVDSLSSIGQITGAEYLSLSNTICNNLTVNFGAPLMFENIGEMEIVNFKCYNCSTSYGNGGSLYIVPGIYNSYIYVDNFVCNLCSAFEGFGGAIFLDSYSMGLQHYLSILNFEAIYCEANDGAGLFISDRFSLSYGELINTTISFSNGGQGGIVTDNHYSGTLIIDNYTSISNSGYFAGIKGYYSYNSIVLNASNIIIENQQSKQSALYFFSLEYNTFVVLTNVSLVTSQSLAIQLNSIKLKIDNFSADSGQGIVVASSSALSGTNMNFIGLNANALGVTGSSNVSCNNCNFKNITNGPAVSVESKSLLLLSNSEFYNISSSAPGMALYMNVCQGNNFIVNCTFSQCQSTAGGLMEIQSSRLTINSSTIKENYSTTMTSGINVMNSQLTLYDNYFYNQSAIMGTFIYGSTNSIINVYSTQFNNGTASNTGGAITLIMSSLYLTNTSFSFNSGVNGGAIYGITLSNITAISSTFYENKNVCDLNGCNGASIYFTGQNLWIKSSKFYSSTSINSLSSIYVESATLVSFDFSIMNGYNTPGLVFFYTTYVSVTNSEFSYLLGAITASNSASKVYEFYNCSFYNNSALGYVDGGALALNTISANITENNFRSNSGNHGGAFMFSCDKSCNLNISNSVFYNNTAIDGGGIFYGCTKNNCKFIIKNSNFEKNYAYIGGGAINWNDTKPVITNSKFYNNSAAYANDIAGIPALLGELTSRRLTEFACGPGVPCDQQIKLTLLDSYYNVMTLYNGYPASMTSLDKGSSVSGLSAAISISGIYNFQNYIIYGNPGTYVNIKISTSAIDTSMQKTVGDNVTYNSTIQLLVYLRSCTAGEQISSTACTTCPEGKYLFDPDTVCNQCPYGAHCPGGWKIYTLPGFWKALPNSTTVYQCNLESACLGSLSESDYTGTCADGYTGNKCLGCQVGYSRSGSYKCGACPSTAQNAVIIVFLMLLIVFISVVLVRSTLKSAYTPKALHSIYIKIFTNYLQLVLLTTKFELQWPYYVIQVFSVQQSAATASDQIFSLDCYFTDKGNSLVQIYYNKIIITALLPVIAWILSFLVWVGICIKYNTWKYMKKELITTMIALFFLIYPNIVRTLFSIFSCNYIIDSGWWISDSLDVPCWDFEHIKYSISVALTGIILWAFGVPTFVLIILIKRRKHLESDTNRVIFGFIYNGYKTSKFFWEFIIMYRKVFIICIWVFMTEVNTSVQALTLIIVLVVGLYLQYEFKPFNKYQLNHMETEAILTATITIYCGMYYLTQSIGEAFKTILFIIIIMGNCYFLFYWLYYMCQAVIDLLVNFVPFLKRLQGKREPFPEYVDSEVSLIKGVYRDEEAGILRYTMIEKEAKKQEKITLPGVKSSKDIFLQFIKNEIKKTRTSATLSEIDHTQLEIIEEEEESD